MVIAIFGKSCVGKSVVATLLSKKMGIPVRHCGRIIRERARSLCISLSNLPASEHKSIDEETIAIATGHQENLIIEGNFLDAVLQGVENILFINLTCEDQERERRYINRLGNHNLDLSSLKARDAADIAHRGSFYTQLKEIKIFTIDTTSRTIDEVVAEILIKIGEI